MTRDKRAMQIWMLLVCAAREGKIYAYSDIAKILKVGNRDIGKYLGPIMWYCENKKYPPLTVLVVKKNAGVPGKGLTTVDDVDKDRAKVYKYDWFAIEPPQISDFENAIKKK
jgi:alkylated DNA nucleotide flippase Atl1